MPIGFHVTDCDDGFHVLYANRVWERWLPPEKLPVAGKSIGEIFPSAERGGMLRVMREVCETSRAQHLKRFEFAELGIAQPAPSGQPRRWDWEIYPLSGREGQVTHLFNVVMRVAEPSPPRSQPTAERRQAQNLRREAASGVLRIFGVAPEHPARVPREQLTEREYEIAELMALGFTNAAAGVRLSVSSATISSHAAHILAKLGFRSRAQVAAWVVAQRLAAASPKRGSGSKTPP
ncbi:MAG: LuxR C-terminal-related transcriptional regulator [Candidatus Dormibacteraeota bacterium]|nr:LuxR C-terminal-related transcriptional regulator [Candidatus Dormibacteraeota bacterium]